METPSSLIDQCRQAVASTGDLEPAIELLRRHQLSKVESIRFLREHLGVPLGDAKQVVHASLTWRDVMERDEGFWGDLERVLRDDGRGEVE
ncbi:hypothetical protein [Blastopirellula marina]|uniref:Uncharacterized protein n=1 Tax=Blastopirellula marina TaxID=124 RepID=A0A2S8GQB1_9BACT|nr:hypothetical protein [Blastopirellula marina]PQO46619.1 hypothetical protein C5Y93_09135 [Blastopirellula marina]